MAVPPAAGAPGPGTGDASDGVTGRATGAAAGGGAAVDAAGAGRCGTGTTDGRLAIGATAPPRYGARPGHGRAAGWVAARRCGAAGRQAGTAGRADGTRGWAQGGRGADVRMGS